MAAARPKRHSLRQYTGWTLLRDRPVCVQVACRKCNDFVRRQIVKMPGLRLSYAAPGLDSFQKTVAVTAPNPANMITLMTLNGVL